MDMLVISKSARQHLVELRENGGCCILLVCCHCRTGSWVDLLQGLQSQNRSVEGDEVAIRICAPSTWWTFKREQQMAQLEAAGRAADDSSGQKLVGTSSGLLGASPNAATADADVHELATPSGATRQICSVALPLC